MEIHLNETEIEFLNSQNFKLTSQELKTIKGKQGVRNQLLFAVMLQYYKIKKTFPEKHNALASYLSQLMEEEIKTEFCYFNEFDIEHRTVKRFRQEIRKIFGFRKPTDADGLSLVSWLVCEHLPNMPQEHETHIALNAYYQSAKIEPFSDKQQERYLDTARTKFEAQLFEKMNLYLSQKDKEFIDTLLNRTENETSNGKQRAKEIHLNTLKKGIPGVKLKNVQFAIEQYEAIRILALPGSITDGLSRKILLKYYDRIMAYSPSHIIELDEYAKYAMVALFCHIRAELLADSLGDLFVKLIRKITKSSENYVAKTADKVTLSNKQGGHIKISPSLPQELPENIVALHSEIIKRWGDINLIDAFQESNVRIGFTRHLETVGKYSHLEPDKLVMRLLLNLYAIGSNTGLKRISIANSDANEAELQYVKIRFINPTNVRLVIREVINAVISIRDPAIFGTATTTVACDSKKLNAWDQNLMNEWHRRYKGHGIMVYWHVDTNALCIHSQSKTCTSSEVGAMLKGVLEHSTKIDLNAAYVNTHGQSTIGFGTSKLLNFKILPRLKNIHKQKLYGVSDSDKQHYKNLEAILKEGIQWKHIEVGYDDAVKHLVALKMSLVESDVFMKRFSKDNYRHPAYKALCEIGKASKTIFLCDYLQQEDLRIEINAGLNIVERLNSVMNFFFYGRLGEIQSNDPDEQELSILCLHLLQACAVYINTLLIQEILSDPVWRNKLTPEDYRALSPLIHSHFNPYSTFLLDLAKRLMISIEDFTHDRDKSNISERESETVSQTA